MPRGIYTRNTVKKGGKGNKPGTQFHDRMDRRRIGSSGKLGKSATLQAASATTRVKRNRQETREDLIARLEKDRNTIDGVIEHLRNMK